MNEAYNIDCMEYMKTLPDKAFDLCLTDPPYGVGVKYGSFDDNRENLKELIDRVMPEILRISKRALITCGNGNQHLYPKPDWTLAWVIEAGAGQNKWGFTCWQPVLAYGNDAYRASGLGARPDILKSNEQSPHDASFHPCPKPLKLWEQLLLRGSVSEKDKIIDPFMGSGTTRIAAYNLNRDFVGCEIDKDYFDAQEERFKAHTAQQSLFSDCKAVGK